MRPHIICQKTENYIDPNALFVYIMSMLIVATSFILVSVVVLAILRSYGEVVVDEVRVDE